MRSQIKKEGDYPIGKTPTKRFALKIDNHTIIQTIYESNSDIDIYLGGVKHWCIHSTIHKENKKIKEEGYLIKIRYDLLCSVEEKIQRGGDITKLLKLLIQYIHDTYPEVKYLLFNDLSTRRCDTLALRGADHPKGMGDNDYDTNLAVMTYLYSGKTWYEKNFDATISLKSKDTLEGIVKEYNNSKNQPWDVISDTIYNYKEIQYTKSELEKLYEEAMTWKEFFEPIFNKIGIAKFCIFISPWLDKFILKYFNNLMGLTYEMPIKETGMKYTKMDFVGGRYKSFFKGARKNKTIKRFIEME